MIFRGHFAYLEGFGTCVLGLNLLAGGLQGSNFQRDSLVDLVGCHILEDV